MEQSKIIDTLETYHYLAELSDDNQTMDVASDQEPAPLSKPVHAVFTIEQVPPHFDALMAEELRA